MLSRGLDVPSLSSVGGRCGKLSPLNPVRLTKRRLKGGDRPSASYKWAMRFALHRAPADDPEALLDRLLEAHRPHWKPESNQRARALVAALSVEVRHTLALAIVRRMRGRVRGATYEYDEEVSALSALLGMVMPDRHGLWPELWPAEVLVALVHEVAAILDEARINAFFVGGREVVHAAVARGTVAPEHQALGEAAATLAAALRRNNPDRQAYAEHRRLLAELAKLLGDRAPGEVPDAWHAVLVADDQHRAVALLDLAASAPARTSQRFLRRRDDLLAQLGAQACRALILAWLEALAAVRPSPDEAPVVSPETADVVRGLVLVAAPFGDEDTARALADLGIAAYRKVPHYGPSSAKIGNACAQALADLPAALPQLARMRTRVRHPPSRRRIDAMLALAAERLAISPAELEEIVVPDFGLDAAGRLRREVEGFTFELAIQGDGVVIAWGGPDGKRRKSPPAEVRRDHPHEVAALKQLAKDVRDALAVQRARLERLLRDDREWASAAWQARYLDHGLVGTLARRLVWRVAGEDGERSVIWAGDGIADVDGVPVTLAEDARVRLWHPIGALSAEVEAWRSWLAAHGIEQPFRQVHREVVVPEEGERRAGAIGRFAGATLRQHQLAALCRERGWTFELWSTAFDSGGHPTLALPTWGLTATLEVDPLSESASSPHAIRLTVTAGDVCFTDSSHRPIDPTDVPLVVVSEVLRDVSLFVSAAAVG